MLIETYLRKNHPVIWRTGVVKATTAGSVFGAILIFLSRWLSEGFSAGDLLIAHVDKIQNAKYLVDIIVLGGVFFWIVKVKRFQLQELTSGQVVRSFVLFFPVCLVLFFGPLQAQVYAVGAVSKLVPGAIDATRSYEKAVVLLLRGGTPSSDLENDLARMLGRKVELRTTAGRDLIDQLDESIGIDLVRRGLDEENRKLGRFAKIEIYKDLHLPAVVRFDLFDIYIDAWIEGARKFAANYMVFAIVEPQQASWSAAPNLGFYELLKTLSQAHGFFNGRGFLLSACTSLLLALFSAILLCAASFASVSSRVRFLSPISLVKMSFAKWFDSLEHYFSRQHPLFWLLGAHRSLIEFLFSLVFVVPVILLLISMTEPLWNREIKLIFYLGVFLLIPTLYLWDWFTRQSNIYQIYNGWRGTLRMLLIAILLVSPLMILTLLVIGLAHVLEIPAHAPLFGSSMSDKEVIVTMAIAVGLCGWAAPLLVMATQNIKYLRVVYVLSAIGFGALYSLLSSFDRTLGGSICAVIVAGSLLFLLYSPQRASLAGKYIMVLASSSVFLNLIATWQLLGLDLGGEQNAFLFYIGGFVFISIYVNQINRINLTPSARG